MSGKISVVSDHAAIEGRFLEFYLGEWTSNGTPVCIAPSVIRPTLIYIRLSLVAPGTSLKQLKWQALVLCDIAFLRLFTAFQRQGRIMASSSTS